MKIIQKRNIIAAGSCNCCQNRDDEYVYELDLKNTLVRLCKKCFDNIIAEYKEMQIKFNPFEKGSIDFVNEKTLYTAKRYKGKLYGPSHGSTDGEKTICDELIDTKWYITNNTFDGRITCKKCLKEIYELREKMRLQNMQKK